MFHSASIFWICLCEGRNPTNRYKLFDNLAFRGVAIVFVWVLAHHMLAGIRHLLSDFDIGSQLPAARRSAWAVNLGGLAVALLAAGALL